VTQVSARQAHDDVVRGQILDLLKQGYTVQARLEGWFERPDKICGYVPDIVAKQGSDMLIIEVKLSEGDWPKLVALRRFVEQHKGARLEVLEPQLANVI